MTQYLNIQSLMHKFRTASNTEHMQDLKVALGLPSCQSALSDVLAVTNESLYGPSQQSRLDAL
jgi:hypothetical protein